MRYCVNVHFDGAVQFQVEADHDAEAQAVAEAMFADLCPEEVARAICEVKAEDAVKQER